MDNFNLNKNKENSLNNNSNYISIYLFIKIIIVKEQLKSEQELSRLTLRKNKLYTIISSKRKIGYSNEIDSEIQNYYNIKENDFNIPPELKITTSKFNQNVSNKKI